MPNVELESPKPSSAFRKIAIGTWATSYDPQVYGTLTVRMERALQFMDEFRARTGKKLTVTHLVAKAVARAFQRMPDANAILRFGKFIPAKSSQYSFRSRWKIRSPENLIFRARHFTKSIR
jgi:pyruvate dehydrogenase E2 component (dihydrolipoamide acetyltransferase)